MKKSLIFAGMFAVGTLFAAEARIDVSGTEDGITFSKEENAITRVNYAPWLKKDNKETQYIYAFCPAWDEWSTMEFSFTPDKSGKIGISLLSKWSSNQAESKFVVFDNLEINGELLKNGSFEDLNQNRCPHDWGYSVKPNIVDDARTGKFMVKVNQENQVMYYFNVEAGKTYTLKAKIKNTQGR